MTVVVAALLAVSVFVYILFVRKGDIPEPVPVSPVQHLDDRKQAIYENLRDLQFEYRVGKLSDDDYQATKQSLQRELALVLAETEKTVKRLDLVPAKPKPTVANRCPHCGANFAQALKFCGECGKQMA